MTSFLSHLPVLEAERRIGRSTTTLLRALGGHRDATVRLTAAMVRRDS